MKNSDGEATIDDVSRVILFTTTIYIIMATSAVEVDAIPAVEVDTIPAVEVDAIPLTLNVDTSQPVHKLNPILNNLTTADYRSIFFLLIDVKLKKEDFLFWVRQERNFLRNKFLNIYYEFCCKDALLIEIFGTMQKYDLLKFLGTCRHIFEKDKDTFTQLSSLWKFLYAVCEQLADGEVDYLKENLFPEDKNINVCCAEELICQAFLKGKLEEKNWKSKLEDIFKSSHPDCSKFITSYKGSKLSYYPLRRPTKTAPCGIAVIMNHVKFDGTFQARPESNSDANALKKLWENFGFKTEIHTDLTAEEVNQVFVKLSKENHSNYDAFVTCYLSHGDEGIVITKDGKPIRLTDLVDLIANGCETLVGKPKLFFVQACQGRGIQTAFTPTKIDAVQGKNNFVVVDGGHLLHKVVWHQNMNFGDIAKSYLTYLQTHYGSNVAVVFDGYPSDVNGKSTKVQNAFDEKTYIHHMRLSSMKPHVQKFLKNNF
ncbi:Caspase-7 [Araneus ventricosus]|uniref:Caspase-7 n=1 Tax=Araneus ventricosus TaxID=182803 RepID=A0A4Y2B8E4_ARAVE|nr:Caspase-7 [Araneus ventricosus]